MNHLPQRQPPVRYRHLVGSQSPLMSDTIRSVIEILQKTPNLEPLTPYWLETHDISNFQHYFTAMEMKKTKDSLNMNIISTTAQQYTSYIEAKKSQSNVLQIIKKI